MVTIYTHVDKPQDRKQKTKHEECMFEDTYQEQLCNNVRPPVWNTVLIQQSMVQAVNKMPCAMSKTNTRTVFTLQLFGGQYIRQGLLN